MSILDNHIVLFSSIYTSSVFYNYLLAYVFFIGKPGFLNLPTSQKKLEQENVTFVCFPTGDPTPTVKWIFKNVFINTTNSVKYYIGHFGESDFGSLTILNLDFFDNGEYICQASNQFGALNTTAVQLDVQGI